MAAGAGGRFFEKDKDQDCLGTTSLLARGRLDIYRVAMASESGRRYAERLRARIEMTGSHLCVGLDPRPEGIGQSMGDFLRRVIDETAPFAAAFKPNMAYFEAGGSDGIRVLEETLAAIPEDIPVILDAKRGDIGETQKYYAAACFDRWNADAVTLSPYLGFESLDPFLSHQGKGVYVLAVTSNPGAADIQLAETADGRRVFERVAEFAGLAAGAAADLGFVVGLTNAAPDVLARIPDAPLLVPGFGAQGGDLEALSGQRRAAPVVVSVSRGILYAEPERSFAEKAESYARETARVLRGGD